MSYEDNRKRGDTPYGPGDEGRNYTGWIVGGIIALAVIAGIMALMGRNEARNTAANPNPPATTAPGTSPSSPATTGSGSTSSNPGANGTGSNSPAPDSR